MVECLEYHLGESYIFPLLPFNKWGSCCLWGYSETSWVVTILTIFTTELPHFGIGKSQDPQSWTPSHHPTSTTGSCPLCTCHPTATHARQWSLTPHTFDWSFGSPYFVLLRADLGFVICFIKLTFISAILLSILHHWLFSSIPILFSFQYTFGHFAPYIHFLNLLGLPLHLWPGLSLKFRIHTRFLLWLTEWFFSVPMFGRHLTLIKDFSDLFIGLLDNQQEVTLIDGHGHKNRKAAPLNKFPWRNIQWMQCSKWMSGRI